MKTLGLIGAVALLDLIVEAFPSPADRAEVTGIDTKTKQETTRALPDFQDWPEQDREPFQHAGQSREGAKRKTAKERFRQNAEDEKINRKGDHDR